jgi:hypothetical protein
MRTIINTDPNQTTLHNNDRLLKHLENYDQFQSKNLEKILCETLTEKKIPIHNRPMFRKILIGKICIQIRNFSDEKTVINGLELCELPLRKNVTISNTTQTLEILTHKRRACNR